MPERLVYKRQKAKAKKAASFLISATAICVILGGVIKSAACVVASQGQSRIAMAREQSFAKITAGAGSFVWNMWSNARCSVVCHMARNHLIEIADKFVRPALASLHLGVGGRGWKQGVLFIYVCCCLILV